VTEASTVFVVDDGPSVRRSTERLVRSMGFAVRTFASAKEFLDNARVEGPVCLVLAVRLPGLSGLDLQRELTQAGVVAGLPNKQIAGELATTERTIKFHRAHIMEKMEAASLAELVQMGGQLGSSPPESRAGPVPKDS